MRQLNSRKDVKMKKILLPLILISIFQSTTWAQEETYSSDLEEEQLYSENESDPDIFYQSDDDERAEDVSIEEEEDNDYQAEN
jgi:hypothetical protein